MATDFLSGVIARAFELAPVLEKRRASIFEPYPHPSRWRMDFGEIDEERPAVAAWPEGAARLRHEGREQQQAPEQAARDLDSETESKERRPMPENSQAPLDRIVERRTAPDETRQRTPDSTLQPIPQISRIEHTLERQLETRQTIHEHREVRTERVIQTQLAKQDLPRIAQAVVRPTKNEHSENFIFQKRVESSQPITERGAKPTREAAPFSVHAPLRARPVPVELTPAPSPAIHVTIGRVELRAPQAPPAPKPVPSRSGIPKLGLDAYMQQRNGDTQ
jgi:hypothetical protein